MTKKTDMPEITQSAQEGAERFALLVTEYKRIRGLQGDVLRPSDHDLYAAILADGFHWAKLLGVDFALAFTDAYGTSVREASPE